MSVIESSLVNSQTNAAVTIEALYRTFAEDLRRLFAGPLGLPKRADDLTHEVFVRLMAAGVVIDPDRRPWPLLRSIAKHLAIDEYRRNRKSIGGVVGPNVNGPSACDEFLSREEALALYDAIADLPERSRNILVGRELAGLPYEQLAEWDGASVHGLRCLTSRAKADLRDLYLVEARKRRLAALAPLIQLPRRLCRRLRDKTTDLGALTPLLPGVANLAFVTAVALVGSQSWDSSRAMAFAAPSPGRSIVLIAADQPTPEVQPASDDLRPSGGRSRGTEQAPVQLALHRGYGQSGIDSHVGGDIGGLGGETNGHDAFVCSGGVVAGLACQVLAQLPAPPAE